MAAPSTRLWRIIGDVESESVLVLVDRRLTPLEVTSWVQAIDPLDGVEKVDTSRYAICIDVASHVVSIEAFVHQLTELLQDPVVGQALGAAGLTNLEVTLRVPDGGPVG